MIESHSTNLSRLVLVCFTILASALIAGCSSSSVAKANSPTGGISMEMSITGKDNFAALYKIDQDGTIHFGGGLDAQLKKTSWTGQLTNEDVDKLVVLLNKSGWFTDEPYSSSIGDDKNYSVKLRWSGGRKSFEVKGRSLFVTPIEDLLKKIANRRHNVFLESLPKATEAPD